MTARSAVPALEAPTATCVAPHSDVFLQRACACGGARSGSCSCADETDEIQAKLTVNAPGDRFEREADKFADSVVSDTAPTPASVSPVTPLAQRAGSGNTAGAPGGSAALAAAASTQTGGTPLSPNERAYFDPRFGRDLSAVRLHTDIGAGRAAQGISARAFTHRNHIAFAPGEYAPGTTEGRRLIAHEITHTLQQTSASGTLQREAGGTAGGFFHNIALFFGASISEEDMQGYLDHVAEIGGPELDYDSDNKALAIAGRIDRSTTEVLGHDSDVGLRKILILDMQDGATLGDEENAIINLLATTNPGEFHQFFQSPNALDANALRSDVDDENQARLNRILLAFGIAAEDLTRPEDNVGCAQEEADAIAGAVEAAEADLGRALEILGDPDQATAVRNAYFLAFHSEEPDPDRLTLLRSQLAGIRRHVSTVRYFCDHGEESASRCREPDILGYAGFNTTARGISICFMPERDYSVDIPEGETAPNDKNLLRQDSMAERSNLITHEAAHLFLGVDDHGYFGSNCVQYDPSAEKSTARLTEADLLDTADSYACFVQLLAHLEGAEEGETLAERAAGQRGENLRLQYTFDHPFAVALQHRIYLGEDIDYERFSLDGVPENSGFEFDWQIETGGVSLPLAADPTFAVGNTEHRAVLGDATRARLRELHAAGATQATVTVNVGIGVGLPYANERSFEMNVELTDETVEELF